MTPPSRGRRASESLRRDLERFMRPLRLYATTPAEGGARGVEEGPRTDRDEELVGLITSSQRVLFAYIRTLVGPVEDVDDILQEVSLILWRRRDEYRGEGRFLSWACHVAYLQVLVHAKKRRRDKHVYYDEGVLADLGELMVERVDQLDDRFEALRSCLAKLPPKHRELISRRYAEGGSVRGVADELGRPADSIKVTLHRLRQSLADCIARTLRGNGRG